MWAHPHYVWLISRGYDSARAQGAAAPVPQFPKNRP
jgi:hypothetical protein